MIAAVPQYVRDAALSFADAPPGHRFRLYFQGWKRPVADDNGSWALETGKLEVLKSCCMGHVESDKHLSMILARRATHAALEGAIVADYTLTAPLATGLGLEHPSENGFAFADPYGVPYVAGSSVKGVLRATAEELVLKGEAGWTLPVFWWLFGFDKASLWHRPMPASKVFRELLTRVGREQLQEFGPLLASERREEFLSDPVAWFNDGRKPLPSLRGALRVWDAYPGTCRLDTEVMTPHHRNYLQASEGDPPLDAEDPVPIEFLVVPAGTRFQFVVAFHPVEATPGWVREQWRALSETLLQVAVGTRGFGAKTSLGFGLDVTQKPIEGTHEVELVTPGFLGGSDADSPEHTTLRASSLKGQLRWWWRTTQVGFLSTSELRAVEDAIWGSTRTGRSPVTVSVARAGDAPVRLRAPYKTRDRNGLVLATTFLQEHGIPVPTGKETIGLAYAAYGMADGKNHRFVVNSGARFRVSLLSRPTKLESGSTELRSAVLSQDQVQEQIDAAWLLLLTFGAVGAKSRHGFGSLHAVNLDAKAPPPVIERARAAGASLRNAIGLKGRTFDERRAKEGYSLDNLVSAPLVVRMPPNRDPWWVMHQIGEALRGVASEWKHLGRKVTLGLPRKIHGPRPNGPSPHQDRGEWQRPSPLRGTGPVVRRHASPVHFSVATHAPGEFEVRVIAFVAGYLPDPDKSRSTLGEYLIKIKERLSRLAEPGGVRTGHGSHERNRAKAGVGGAAVDSPPTGRKERQPSRDGQRIAATPLADTPNIRAEQKESLPQDLRLLREKLEGCDASVLGTLIDQEFKKPSGEHRRVIASYFKNALIRLHKWNDRIWIRRVDAVKNALGERR